MESIMTAWVLILTLLPMPSTYNGPTSITTHEFTPQTACINAGDVWLQRINSKGSPAVAVAVCTKG